MHAHRLQTKEKKGLNAHPKHWRALLEHERWRDLRLCLGHAGGGRASNLGVSSAGWMADNDAEWSDADNFARIVADLCATYPNVYCELGYITELLDDPTARELLVANIERARAEARQNGRPTTSWTRSPTARTGTCPAWSTTRRATWTCSSTS